MTQLIQQQKIDEAASGYFDEKEQKIFKFGVQFAVNEIQPLIVECLNYAFKNYHSFDGIIVPINTNDVFREITTQQLLEEFINYKNKENE